MKILELFEAQGSPGQRGRQGGAYYNPGYDEDKKVLVGSVLDWMDAAGITKADIAQAVEQIKQDAIIQKMADAGMKLISKPESEKRGTITFEVTREYPNGKKAKTLYQVYANGQIRYSGNSIYAAHQGKMKSPKPRFKAGDAVGSLLMIYKQAMEELLAKKKSIVKEARKVPQKLGKALDEFYGEDYYFDDMDKPHHIPAKGLPTLSKEKFMGKTHYFIFGAREKEEKLKKFLLDKGFNVDANYQGGIAILPADKK